MNIVLLQAGACLVCYAAGAGEPAASLTERLRASAWRFGREFLNSKGRLERRDADVIDVTVFNGFVAIRYKHASGVIIGRAQGRTLRGRYFQRNIEGDIELTFDSALAHARGRRRVVTRRVNRRFRVWLDRVGPAAYDQPIRSPADLHFDGPSRFPNALKDPRGADLALYGMRRRNISVMMRYYNFSDAPTEPITHYVTLPESDAHQQVLRLRVAPAPVKEYRLASGPRIVELRLPALPPGGCAFGCWSADMILSRARVMFDSKRLKGLDALPRGIEPFLGPGRKLALDSPEVTRAAAQCAAGAANPLDIVRATHHYVMDALYYKWCGWPPVNVVLRRGHGVCGDYSRVVTALCRKNGVPCRDVYGFRAPGRMDEPDFAFGYVDHAWNEVYVPGYGWIPLDSTVNDSQRNRDWLLGFITAGHIVWRRRTGEPRPSGRGTPHPWLHRWKWRWDRYWTKSATISPAELASWRERIAGAASWAAVARVLAGADAETRSALAAALLVEAGRLPAMNAHLTQQPVAAEEQLRVLKLLAAAARLGDRIAYWLLLAADNGRLAAAPRAFWSEAVEATTEPESLRALQQRLAMPGVRYAYKVVPLRVLEVEPTDAPGRFRITALREFPKRSVYDEMLKRFLHDRWLPVNWPFGLACDGRRFYVSERRGGRILKVEFDRRGVEPIPLTGAKLSLARGLAVTGGGKLLAAVDRTILEINPRTGRARRVFRGRKMILGLAWTPDTLYVSRHRDPNIAALDPKTFARRAALRTPVFELRGVRGMTARGDELWITDSGARRIVVLDRRTGAVRFRLFPRYEMYVNGLAFARGRLYATQTFNNVNRLCYTYFRRLPGPGNAVRSARHRVKVRYRVRLENRGPQPVNALRAGLPVLLNTPRQRVESLRYVGGEPKVTPLDNGGRVAVFGRGALQPKEKWECGWDAVGVFDSLLFNPRPEDAGAVDETPADVRRRFLADAPEFDLHSPALAKHAAACAPAGERNAMRLALAIRNYVFNRLYLRTLRLNAWKPAPVVLDQGFGSNEEYARAFVALCRARGLAARVCGSYAMPNQPLLRGVVQNQTRSKKYRRVWTEVYLPRIGWAPVEMDIEDAGDRPPHHERLLWGLTWRYARMTSGYSPCPDGTRTLGPWWTARGVSPAAKRRVKWQETVSFVVLDELME